MTHVHVQGFLSSEDLSKERRKFGFNDTDDFDTCVWSYCWRLQYAKGPPPPIGNGSPRKPPHEWQEQSASKTDRNEKSNGNDGRKPTPTCKGKTSTPTASTPLPRDRSIEELIRKGNEYWENTKRQNRGKRQASASTTVNQTSENLG